MATPGLGYGDSLCLLSIAQDLKKETDPRVVVMAAHPEVFNGQPGLDAVYWTGNALGFWDKECSDADTVFTFPYWEVTGRMRGLPDTLLNVLRKMAQLGPAREFPTFKIPNEDQLFVRELREKLGREYVVVQRGLGRPIKLIGMDVMKGVVRELKADYDVVQSGYAHDERIPGTLDMTKDCSFTRTVALMAGAKFIVGHDSMPSHLSGIIEVPGVFIYGPTSPADFGYAHNENVFLGVCSQSPKVPCGRPAPWFYDYVAKEGGGYKDWECPNRTCMDRVSVKVILDAVERLKARLGSISWVPERGVV